MSEAMKVMIQNGHSYDVPDRMPENIHVTRLDIFMYVVAIVGHLVDLGVDINVAMRYFLAQKMTEFGWTLAFILIPAFVNTAVSVRMYAQDKEQLESLTNEVTRIKWLRIFILVLQMAPVLRFTDALIYAVKSRRAEIANDRVSQREYYRLMLKEDSDAALLRVFECFLEAAPQHVLQACLLLHTHREFADLLLVHQVLSILSSIVGMGWCLGSYNRAIRFAQDKDNLTWCSTGVQTTYHFLISSSRIISITVIAYLFPYWTILACLIHIMVMATVVQIYDNSPFCSHNKVAGFAFSMALGAVYLFTYILPVEGRTRYRFMLYYSLCFLQNVTCGMLWYLYVGDVERVTVYFLPLLLLTVVPFVTGIGLMVGYYGFFHPKSKEIRLTVSYMVKAIEEAS